MYLKRLELQGFKSFPEKTVLTFDRAITAIVGPNGSGKSNISDALLWVMGEQRSRALRGGKMEDVIFGGTEKRSPMGFAQVSLVLDNAKGLFPVDAPEVVITRRYYRSGESEYRLNRETVRLKDIISLLMDTGLGRDGYSVIGQGRIAEIVSAKSTDRREIFEEAAGISRFRYRKEEAERKLERTEENLLRINDKIDELSLQLAPLKKQAETAKKYLLLRDEQRELEISVWMETLDRLHVRTETLNAEYALSNSTLCAAQKELETLYAESEEFSEKMRECDLDAERVRMQQGAAEQAAAECERSAAVLSTNLEHNAENLQRLREEISEQSGRTESLRSQIAAQQARAVEIDALLAENTRQTALLQNQAVENEVSSGEMQQSLTALVIQENDAADALSRCTAELSMHTGRREELNHRASQIDADIGAAEKQRAAYAAALRDAEQTYEKAMARTNELENVLHGHRMLLDGRERAVREQTAEKNRLTVEKRSAEARVHLLSEMEKEYEGMGKAVKAVMRAAERGTLQGVRGPVAKLLTVPDRYAVAIETALGAAMQNIVVENQNCGKAAIELLKRSDAGRATFLPIDTIRPSTLQRKPPVANGCHGVAVELVSFAPEYAGIFGNLLGRTVVAETLSDAIRLSRQFESRVRIVTLDGQMINAGGSMTGGSAARNVGILSRANELARLSERLSALTAQEKQASEQLAEAERTLAAAKYESEQAAAALDEGRDALHKAETALAQRRLLDETRAKALEDLLAEKNGLSANVQENEAAAAALESERQTVAERLEQLRTQRAELSAGQADFERRRQALSEQVAALRAARAALESERETAQRAYEQLEQLLTALTGDSAQREAAIAELQARRTALESELAECRAQAESHRKLAARQKTELAALSASRLEWEGRRTRSDKAGQDKNREIMDLQSACAACEQKKLSAELEEKQILDKLWDNYELSRSAAQQQRHPVENVAAANKRIAELRRETGSLGNVNIGAIEEYDRLNERHGFLSGQRDDVEAAKRDLVKIIGDITGEMKEIFLREFAAIDTSFRAVFLELFGGGKASLELEDPQDPLGCGIEIHVQPPGKAVTTISLLSGGEKSFVAICLYFAIIKVRPTPFCIMDEIDAALDEANVERYARYMRTLTENTQFIAITHHRATMEEADVLYGVTMQEKGVTTVLSLDLDEAERTASQ
ncbi:MAG: chromosome segregation protein SMC [Oscillospiraceae bacterium]|nr:chromosome segregation protein SMC [Oscillospiraceae bacterium]